MLNPHSNHRLNNCLIEAGIHPLALQKFLKIALASQTPIEHVDKKDEFEYGLGAHHAELLVILISS